MLIGNKINTTQLWKVSIHFINELSLTTINESIGIFVYKLTIILRIFKIHIFKISTGLEK